MEETRKKVISKNITHYRKSLGITQAELAKRLKYSDKAVSKWERGEALPDISVLNQMAGIFGISIDKLCQEHEYEKTVFKTNVGKKRFLIAIMSAGLVWLVATALFAFVAIILGDYTNLWKIFVWAVPATAIVLLVFNCLWGKRIGTFTLVSIIIWTSALSFYLSIPATLIHLLFAVCVPLQILAILWFFYRHLKSPFKRKQPKS
ncbi:MAG: helix-turn-helix domain-containing protein [Firmicutes bacterium]|nr:helix-turn-helix domain-containing protein [Bacillota bacterium]